jgi:NAD(P)-dependent dehydrogenase (short-subunit alcohol dehydrogenase family)
MATWLVTGASRGFGRSICEQALGRGHRVVATARSTTSLDPLADAFPNRLLSLPLDVTDSASIAAAVEQTLAWSPSIGVLVNNAGSGIHGAIEEVSEEETAALFDANVFGLLRVTRAVLPVMRRQHSGHIINLSSAAGFVAGAGSGIYASTKFAVEGLSEALAAEVGPLGIKVTLIEPGSFRTDFNGSSIRIAAREIQDYAETAGKRARALRESSGRQPGDPGKVAEAICNIAGTEKPPLHLVLGNTGIDRVRAKLAVVDAELTQWESVSRSTDYET